MKTTYKLFFSFLFCCLTLFLGGCSSQTTAQSENQAATNTVKNDATQAKKSETKNIPEDKNATILSLAAHMNADIEEEFLSDTPDEPAPLAPIIPQMVIKAEDNALRPIFSPDGKKIIIVRGPTIEIHDLETQKVLHTLEKGVRERSSSAKLSSDGKKIVVGTKADENMIYQIWDTESGKKLQQFEGKFDNGVFSPDGKTFLTRTQNWTERQIENTPSRGFRRPDGSWQNFYLESTFYHLWAIESGKELHKWEEDFDASFLSNGKKIDLSREDKNSDTGRIERSLYLLDTETGEKLKMEGYGYYNEAPDGKKILVHGRGYYINDNPDRESWLLVDPGAVAVWDIELETELYKLEGLYNRAYFAQDGKRIIAITDTETKILDAETQREWKKLEGKVNFADFSPDGKKLITNTDDATIIWDAETGKELLKLKELTGRLETAQFSPNGKIIVTRGEGNTIIWDADIGKALYHDDFGAHSGKIVFSPDGTRVFVASDNDWAVFRNWTIWYIRETNTGTVVENLDLRQLPQLHNAGSDGGTDWSPDGTRVVVSSHAGDRFILDLTKVDVVAIAKQLADQKAGAKKIKKEREEKYRAAEEKHLATIAAVLGKAVNFNEALLQSGFDNVSEYARFGSAERQRTLQQGNALERARATQEIENVQTDIAQKVFVGEYEYTCDDSESHVDLDENRSRFAIIVPTGFVGLSSSHGWIMRSDIFNLDMSRLTSESEWQDFRKEVMDWGFPDVSLYLPDREHLEHMRAEAKRGIGIEVSGSIKCFERFVQDKDNYRIKVWFTNLRCDNGVTSADVLKIEIVKVQ